VTVAIHNPGRNEKPVMAQRLQLRIAKLGATAVVLLATGASPPHSGGAADLEEGFATVSGG
jgi:hypothetical protein